MSENNLILKINSVLSDKPFFVSISDDSMSVNDIFNKAISSLSAAGKPLESQQLSELYREHQLFNNGKVIQKGDLFNTLHKKTQVIADKTVEIAEIDLVTSHSGGF